MTDHELAGIQKRVKDATPEGSLMWIIPRGSLNLTNEQCVFIEGARADVRALLAELALCKSSMTEQAVILSESAARYRDRAVKAENELDLALRTIRLLAKTAEGDRESRQLLAVWWEQVQADVDIVIAALLRRDESV